jgi:hypothetical protein
MYRSRVSFWKFYRLDSTSHLISEDTTIRTYKTTVLPVVLYGSQTWSITFREEHRLRVFEKELLRRIFLRKRYEVTGSWINLHNEELYNLFSPRNIIRMLESRRVRWAGHV